MDATLSATFFSKLMSDYGLLGLVSAGALSYAVWAERRNMAARDEFDRRLDAQRAECDAAEAKMRADHVAEVNSLRAEVSHLQTSRLADANLFSSKMLEIAQQCRDTIDRVTDAFTKK